MLKNEEVKVLDKNASFLGVPQSALMENAGKSVAEVVMKKFGPKKVLIFCGSGNNGGDGFVTARHLVKKCSVKIILVKKIKSELARNNFEKVEEMALPIEEADEQITQCDLIIDAMLGIGIRGELRDPYANIAKKINASGKPIVAVDIPTGLGTNLSISPDLTITFHDLKEGMNKENSGEIIIKDIGIPADAEKFIGPGELVYYPVPRPSSHKGENGVVLVIGGGPYTGAPYLVGMAALRTGADLAFIVTPRSSWEVVASFSPNLIVRPLNREILVPEDVPTIKKILEKADSVVIGPGLGEKAKTREAIRLIIEECSEMPMVIDADAIQSNVEGEGVITPHAGEFEELTGIGLPKENKKRCDIVKEWAGKLGMTILLKGTIDIISDGKRVKMNKVHNVGMTVGGTGDVLSGIVGALLSKGAESFNAARMGAFINGMGGNMAFNKYSYGMLATDIIDEIPIVLKKYL